MKPFLIVLVDTNIMEIAVASMFEQWCREQMFAPPKFVYRTPFDPMNTSNGQKYPIHIRDLSAATTICHLLPINKIDSNKISTATKINDIAVVGMVRAAKMGWVNDIAPGGAVDVKTYFTHVQLMYSTLTSEFMFVAMGKNAHEYQEHRASKSGIFKTNDSFVNYILQSGDIYRRLHAEQQQHTTDISKALHLGSKVSALHTGVGLYAGAVAAEMVNITNEQGGNVELDESMDEVISTYRRAVRNVSARNQHTVLSDSTRTRFYNAVHHACLDSN